MQQVEHDSDYINIRPWKIIGVDLKVHLITWIDRASPQVHEFLNIGTLHSNILILCPSHTLNRAAF